MDTAIFDLGKVFLIINKKNRKRVYVDRNVVEVFVSIYGVELFLEHCCDSITG